MRIIKYKAVDSFTFRNYIDIGSCERDYYCIDFFLAVKLEGKSGKISFDSYNSWFEHFKNESIGSKLIIIHYYLSEYLGWNNGSNSPQQDYFSDIYGSKTLSVIRNNLNYLLQFHDQWFYHQSSLFKGLDLDFDDIEESIYKTEENNDGIITEIEFEDGSSVKFIDEDDRIKSFYVPEEEYFELKNEIAKIESMFEP